MSQSILHYRGIVDERLREYFENDCNFSLVVPMSHVLNTRGKRIRPLLAFASTLFLKKDPQRVIDLALALEFVHTFSLVHDDLPAMDNAAFRRGKPTLHVLFGDGAAVLAGDMLLTEAFHILSRLEFEPGLVLQVIQLISDTVGYKGMGEGQSLDLKTVRGSSSYEQLLTIARLKTAGLMSASLLSPAILFEANEEAKKALFAYSENLGIAFQMADDITDAGGDQQETFTTFLGTDRTREEMLRFHDSAVRALEEFGDEKTMLVEMADRIITRKN